MSAARIELLGVPIDRVTEAEAIWTVLDGLANDRGGFVVTPNLDQLRRLCAEPALRGLYRDADLVVADGMPLVWASRLQGTPLPERVPGSDVVWSLTAEAALRGRSVFLLGGAPGACEAASDRLRALYPGVRLAGWHCPPVGFEHDADRIAEIVANLRSARPDLVYVALGFPKQERLIAYLRRELPSAWFLGVGYSLSFLAGHTPRAPQWMIRMGLEWVHRLAHEPRRLAKRYLVHGLPFAIRLFAAALAARARGRAPAGAQALERAAAPAGRVVFAYGAVERERARLLDDLMRET